MSRVVLGIEALIVVSKLKSQESSSASINPLLFGAVASVLRVSILTEWHTDAQTLFTINEIPSLYFCRYVLSEIHKTFIFLPSVWSKTSFPCSEIYETNYLVQHFK